VAGHILHIITGLATGGAERSLFNLAVAEPARGFSHTVVSLTGMGHYGPLMKEGGVPVHALGISGAASLLAAPFKLGKLVRQIGPDIMQGWMPHGNVAATVAASMARRPVRVAWNIRQSLYDLNAEKRGTQWMIRGLKTLSRRPDAIIYNSYQGREHHEALGFFSSRGIVIPNGFDTDRWKPDAGHRSALRAAIGVAEGVPVGGFVGRFHALKDVPTFMSASAVALAEVPELHIVMVGDGLIRENSALEGLFAKLPPQRFHTPGRRDDIETILPGFDFFCLSSASEAFPNVLGEAMASGLPSIATDVGDCARLLDGHGRIVHRGDPGIMAKAMVEMARMDIASRAEIGKAARARITTSYGLAATVDAYSQLYDSIMKREV
jgi:glycosyltransferase involved in cell wall biosynthesis